MVALVGNPNCGKSTLFNRLTGGNAHVGNWTGVTVEQKSGFLRGTAIEIFDLPGIYSMAAYSPEERVSRDFLLQNRQACILNLLDGRALERGLYLTMQLLELGCNLIVAIGMMDEVKAAGIQIDCALLEKCLGVPVVPVAARAGRGIDALAALLCGMENAAMQVLPHVQIRYDNALEIAVSRIMAALQARNGVCTRFEALAALEGELPQQKQFLTVMQRREVLLARRAYEQQAGEDAACACAGARYHKIEEILEQTVSIPRQNTPSSDRIDALVLHRVLAIPIFAIFMAGMFYICFGGPGAYLKDALALLFERLSAFAGGYLPTLHVPAPVCALLTDGVLGGVGSVVTFLPQIALLFLCLSLLEESGYLARAAFLMDLPLRKIGLTGKSFIPMLMGFGCTTSAVMAARTLENEGDRRRTICLTPYFSCGAKLPVYALFAGTFFPQHQGVTVALLYLAGIAAAVCCGLYQSAGKKRSARAPFLLEIPHYRAPALRSVWKNTMERCNDFIKKAGTLIFLLSIVIWLLQHFDGRLQFTAQMEESLFSAVGERVAPLFCPLGFGFPAAAVALLAGAVSKEAIVSTLSVTCGTAGSAQALTSALSALFTPLSAASFLIFCALYAPCVSALASMRRELHSVKQMLRCAVIQTGIAYFAALAVYQIGLLLSRL